MKGDLNSLSAVKSYDYKAVRAKVIIEIGEMDKFRENIHTRNPTYPNLNVVNSACTDYTLGVEL